MLRRVYGSQPALETPQADDLAMLGCVAYLATVLAMVWRQSFVGRNWWWAIVALFPPLVVVGPSGHKLSHFKNANLKKRVEISPKKVREKRRT